MSDEPRPIDDAHRSWLREEMGAWVRDGVIDEDAAARIRARYASDAVPRADARSMLVFGVLGGVLIAAGLTLLVAHNWDELGRPARAAIAVGLLVLAQAVAGVALARSRVPTAFTESAAVFLVGALGTTMTLVTQTYHLGGELADLVLAWLVLAMPVPYLLSSRVAATFLWPLLLYLPLGRDESWDQGYSFVLLAAALLPCTVLARRWSPNEMRSRVLGFATAAASCVGMGMLVESRTDGILLPALLACFVLVRMFGRNEGSDATSTVATLAIGIAALTGTTTDIFEDIHRVMVRWSAAENVFVGIIVAAFAVSIMRWNTFSMAGRRDSASALAAIPVSLFGLMLAKLEQFGLASALFNVFVLGFGLEHVLRGLASLRKGKTNLGLALLSGLFLVRFLDEDLSFLVRGLGMMGVGLAFLLVNVWLVRKSREARA